MFIYNVKLNGKVLFKIIFCFLTIIISILLLMSSFKLISSSFKVNDEDISEINIIDEENYTNVLKSTYENVDNYIGKNICLSGYLYKQDDFNDNQFVVARNMLTSNPDVTYIVGFLCENKETITFKENSWIEIEGTIKKYDYNGSKIPIIKVKRIKQISKPDNEFVNMPDDTYIPTVNMF